ncbi:YT521-B-like domain-containing protein [Gloeopeniophorella convolvens]|nr:YT521-B-like domain-containing protein [Gloeopeniophorella convolvens]
MPILQQHAPLYPYQGHSPDVASSSQHTFTSGAAPSTLPVYSHVSVNPSPPPHSPLSPQQSSTGPTGGAQHSAPYASPGAFTPVGYATPPQYAYPPPPSFAPTPPIYGSQYTHSHYPQPYGSPGDQDGQGTWWYLPPNAATTSSSFDAMQHAFRQQFNLGYPSMGQQQEDDIYAQSTAAEQPASSSPAQPDQRPLGESPPEGTHEDSPTPLPASLPLVPQSKATESPSVGDSQRERQQVRRSYHPNPPAHRSEWVMWAGNVPSDATHDELWRFFNQPLPSPSPGEADTSADQQVSGGVSSIFLISRSNCAFINFATEAHLNAATARFHGQPIRPNDQRCPRLVCRVRRRTDDLRAGVGAQRGNGIHIKWVREQKEKARSDRVRPETANSPEEVLSRSSLSLSVSDDDSREPGQVTVTAHSNSSGSFASTNSSILTRYFPRRFFILKSLTQYDLDLSVQKKVWATQRHNEEILDQAYRTSKDVFLIFGVNKSGEFYGYARMAGPISHSDGRIAWASPSGSSGPSSRTSAASGANLDVSISPLEATLARRQDPRYILPPEEHRVAEDSPQPESHSQEEVPVRSRRNQAASAPAELHDSHRRLTHSVPIPGMSLNVPRSTLPPQSSPFQLNPDAPYHALKNPSDDETRRAVEGVSIPTPSDDRREASEPALGTTLQSVAEEPVKEAAEPKDPEEVWGRPFPVEWIHTERLPFFRTRHLRNPWNHGREVKVSRDGTELEPAVGQQLLDEWDRPPPSPAESSAPPRTAPQRRGARSAQHPP